MNGAATTHFIYDTQYRVIEERDNSGAVVATYTYGQGMDEPLTMERSGQTYYYHRDALGSITEVSDSTGTIVERYEYDVYGEFTIFDASDTEIAASAIGNPYLFTARRYDAESGNYYYRARYYSHDLGRFLSQDPLGFDAGDYNLYRYVFNNPINATDPTGEVAWFIPMLASASAEAIADALMQATVNYFFDPNITTVAQAFESIDPAQVGVAFLSGLIPGGRLLKSAVGATGQVLLNYLEALSNCVEYTPGQALFDFAFGLGFEVIGSYLGDAVAKWGPQAAARGLRRLGFDDEAEKLLRNADEFIDSIDNGKNDNNTPSPGCAFNSFSADTEVATQEGVQAISTLEIGDMVLAYNEATGEIDYYPVIATISHEDPVVQYLTIDDETVVTTPNHPFYTTAGEWVTAGELKIGDTILRANSEHGTITATTYAYQPQSMYNLTVDTAHTYFIGEKEWLVHNNNKCWQVGNRNVANVAGNTSIKPGTQGDVSKAHVEMYAQAMSEGKFDWNSMEKFSGDDPITFWRTSDGHLIVQEGHHRFLAAQLSNTPIPFDNPNAVQYVDIHFPLKDVSFIAGDWNNYRWR